MKNLIPLVLVAVVFQLNAQAELFAGHFSTTVVSDLEIEINSDIYTSADAPIDSVTICFGDGVCEQLGFDFQQPISPLNMVKSHFSTRHTYSGSASYKITIVECCWSPEGLNTPGFENSAFLLEREHTFFNPIIEEPNNSSVASIPIDVVEGNVNEAFNFSPAFYDPDGDSLVVEFIAPRGDATVESNYLFPDEIIPGPNNVFNSQNGQISWDSPQAVGNYHIAYEVTEYRNDVAISFSYGVSVIVIQNQTNTDDLFANKFKMYPNPTTDILYFEGETFDKIEVFDLLGKKLKSESNSLNHISVSDLPDGLYQIALFQGAEKYSALVVKN